MQKSSKPSASECPTFNLVELVVCLTIAIVAISLVMPFLYRSALQAKTAKCSSNLKTLGTWIRTYTEAADGFLPAYEDGWVSQIGSYGTITVNPRTKPVDEFSCPSQSFTSYKEGISAGDYWRGSYYGINQHIASKLTNKFGENYPEWTQLNIETIAQPSLKVVVADATGGNYFGLDGFDPVIAGLSTQGKSYADALPPDPAKPFPYMRHLQGAGNFLFLDGHVETKQSWPNFMRGPGTGGFYFWHGEHTLAKPKAGRN